MPAIHTGERAEEESANQWQGAAIGHRLTFIVTVHVAA